MAGGFGRKGDPLHARVRRDRASPDDPPPGAADVAACPVRHCWVSAPVDGGPRRPGLLLEWRRTTDGRWQGRVAYAAELRPDRWATVEEWLPADALRGPP